MHGYLIKYLFTASDIRQLIYYRNEQKVCFYIIHLQLLQQYGILISTYKFERAFFRHDRRTAPKFGTHVWIETRLALTQRKMTNPTPEGFRGYLLMFAGGMFVGGMWHDSSRLCSRPHSHESVIFFEFLGFIFFKLWRVW